MIIFAYKIITYPAIIVLISILAGSILSIPTSSKAFAVDPVSVSIALNKLEPLNKSCRAYLVIANSNGGSYAALDLEPALFQPEGVIGRGVTINLAPLRLAKKLVNFFDYQGIPHTMIGSFLFKKVLVTNSAADPIENYHSGRQEKSLTQVRIIL